MGHKIKVFISVIYFVGLIFSFTGCKTPNEINDLATSKSTWVKFGPGGGGSTFIPTFSYASPDNFLIRCDMTGSYITKDGACLHS